MQWLQFTYKRDGVIWHSFTINKTMDVIIIHMRIIAVDSLWPDDAIWLIEQGQLWLW